MKKIVNHLLTLTLVGSAAAQAQTFKDMVFVDTDKIPSSQRSNALRPFYIEIFEVSGAEALSFIPGVSYTSTKPARVTLAQAKEICTKKGMRLPSREEWLAAASNLSQNRRYSTVGDEIVRPDGSFAVNIRTGDSYLPEDVRNGIDAIGTMGMTGNRAEYYLNADGSSGMCGGSYETTSQVDVELNRTCSRPSDERSTLRCVVDNNAAIRVQLSSRVPSALLNHIQKIGQPNVNPTNPGTNPDPTNPTNPSNPPVEEKDPKFDDEF